MKKLLLLLFLLVAASKVFAQTTSDNTSLFTLSAQGLVSGMPTSAQGALQFRANQTWSSTAKGTKFQISTTPNNSTLPLTRLFINHNGKVGIGYYGAGSLLFSEPNYQLEVLQSDTDDRGVGVFRYGGEAPSFFGIGAQGSILLPFATGNNDFLARFGGRGYDGSGYTTAKVRIDMNATETWTNTSNGTNMSFFTTPNGTTNPAERIRINNAGKVGISTTTPNALLAINGDISFSPVNPTFFYNPSTNNLDREGKTFITLTGLTTPGDLNGIKDGTEGVVVHIIVGGTGSLKIVNEDTSVPAKDRIVTGEPSISPNITIDGNGGCTLIYDGLSQRWRLIGIQK